MSVILSVLVGEGWEEYRTSARVEIKTWMVACSGGDGGDGGDGSGGAVCVLWWAGRMGRNEEVPCI